MKVGEWGVFGIDKMPATLKRARATAYNDSRQRTVSVAVAVADRRDEQDDRRESAFLVTKIVGLIQPYSLGAFYACS